MLEDSAAGGGGSLGERPTAAIAGLVGLSVVLSAGQSALTCLQRAQMIHALQDEHPDVVSGKVEPYGGLLSKTLRRLIAEEGNIRAPLRGTLAYYTRLAFHLFVDGRKDLSFPLPVYYFFTYPLEVAYVRLATDIGTTKYKGIWDSIRTLVNGSEGLSTIIASWAAWHTADYTNDVVLKVGYEVAKATGWSGETVAIPCALANHCLEYFGHNVAYKLALQAGRGRGDEGPWDCVCQTYRKEGLAGFFKGFLEWSLIQAGMIAMVRSTQFLPV